MDSFISPKDEIWFLRMCHHISTGLYNLRTGRSTDCCLALLGAVGPTSCSIGHTSRYYDNPLLEVYCHVDIRYQNLCSCLVAREHAWGYCGSHFIDKIPVLCRGHYKQIPDSVTAESSSRCECES